MAELSPEAEQQLADLSTGDFLALCARVRLPEESIGIVDPKVLAAEALRRHIVSGTVESVTKEFAHEQELKQ